jgi:NAD(P)-dependent dehydrogenase (short-subunit alcohol dehydrogenase family)
MTGCGPNPLLSGTAGGRGGTRLAVVTGASGGSGRAVVERLRGDGMEVASVDVCSIAGTEHEVSFRCDVSDPDAVRGLAVDVEGALGSASAVVNCAGVGSWFKLVGDMEIEEWERVIRSNLTSAFLMTRAFLPALVATKGAIVNLGSVHAVATAPGSGAYAASKAGLFGLTKAIAVDYGELGVRANCLVLGSVDTRMTRDYEEEALARGIGGLAIRPWQRTRPGPVADVVSFLVSEGARFINGSLIAVDGGLLSWL